jgi:hypothetical protein
LVFDKHWNLFGNDNDHESLPLAYVPGRLIHVTPHSDFAWPRGWMPHITLTVRTSPRNSATICSSPAGEFAR